MRRVFASSAIVMSLVWGCGHAIAAAPDNLVIAGGHPNQADAASERARPQRRIASASGLGGGFLQFLATGVSGEPATYTAPRPAAPAHYAPTYQNYAPTRAASIGGVASPSGYAALSPASPGVVSAEPDPQYRRQEVNYSTQESPGAVVIDTPDKFLYLVEPDGKALRYGVGVGRPGFEWAGVKHISRKAEWPGWTPPPEMMLRRPDLPAHMDGGPENPLGARALYLGSSMYRIHGTNEPSTIGLNLSSGCIRMMNEDVIDLYNRVSVGTKVIVM